MHHMSKRERKERRQGAADRRMAAVEGFDGAERRHGPNNRRRISRPSNYGR